MMMIVSCSNLVMFCSIAGTSQLVILSGENLDRSIVLLHQELKLNCNDDDDLTTMEINGVYYWVLDINPDTRTLRIARKDYHNGICSPEFPNTTINPEIFDYSDGYENMTFLYDCPKPTPGLVVHFNCPSSNNVKYKDWSILAGTNGPGPCNASVVVPFPRKLNWKTIDNPSDMGKFLKEGFVLKWKFGGLPCVDCTKREGSCGPDHSGYSNVTIGVCPPSSSLPDQAPKESPSSVLHDQAPTGSPDSTGTQPQLD
ncbi:hypothetical protein EZV62_004975 [Acer yangbiense]|uniref:Wall-associated receptor kinase C-terminal domain-containing protein n=1 Tax=Acer yangbiense TaxID=1000413 RepID=A0A5C7ILL8_9ROSI|nr:hypothetical protein EZV62_004975 [Acer yangbiense]